MLSFLWILFFLFFFLFLSEFFNILTLSSKNLLNTLNKLIKFDFNGLIDNIILIYSLFIIIIILEYYKYQRKKNKNKKLQVNYVNINLNENKNKNIITNENWKEKFDGIWQQFKAEGLEEFGELTEPSAMRRTLGAIAFFKVRHTISIKDGYFNLQRDLGMSVSVWNLRALIGKNKETCQSVSVPVETGGNYRFRVWIDEDKKELYMESTPDDGQEGVTTIQTRSLIDNDLMKMVISSLLFYYLINYYFILKYIFL